MYGATYEAALLSSNGFSSIGLIALCRLWFAQAGQDFDSKFVKSLRDEHTVIHATLANTEQALGILLYHLELLMDDPDDEVCLI